MKYLLLGSSGVLGSNLALYLKNQGNIVYEFDIINSINEDLRIKNNHLLIELLQNVDLVYFLAFDVGGAKYLDSEGKKFDFIHNNMLIISNTFFLIEKFNKKLIFLSSYMADSPSSPYGFLKRIGEYYSDSLDCITVRIYNVFSNENVSVKSHVISDMIWQAKTFGLIKLNTNGQEARQFLYVDDFCEALDVITKAYDTLVKHKKIINVSSFEWVKIIDIANIISNLLDCGIECSDTLASYNIKNNPDKLILEYWKPKYTLTEGILKLI
jgi:nucleoside-diphosphate-sugar epimerase